MWAWRIAREGVALDRTGAGSLHAEGRWHRRGVPVIYAGLGAEICALEKLVHTGPLLPIDLVVVALSLPDAPGLYETPDLGGLPGWDATPPGSSSADFGTAFLRSGRALGFVVPSAAMPEARNLVLNPLHPRFADVAMALIRPFRFDSRLRPV